MTSSTTQVWGVIAALAVGTFVIRFSFLGLIGSKQLPPWALRMLRYTPVAVLPGLVAPLVVWPPDAPALNPAHLIAAVITVAVGRLTRSVAWALVGGGAAFAGLGYLMS